MMSTSIRERSLEVVQHSRNRQERGPATCNDVARRAFRLLAGFTVLGGLLAFAAPTPVFGQAPKDGKERRQRIVDDVLKGLRDSGMDGFDEYIDLRPSHAAPGGRPESDSVLQPIRRAFASFAEESKLLVNGLNNDLDYIPGVRPLLGDAIQIGANAAVLNEKSKQITNKSVLAPEFETLDRQWRSLSYRLRQVQNLDRTCLARVDKLDELDRTLCDSFRIQKQVNRRDLATRTASIASGLSNLREDIELELEPGDLRNQLVLTTQKLEQQAEHISYIVNDNADYETLVSEYKRFQDLWYPHAAKLRPIENPYVERNVRRIAQNNKAVHELLWLPQQVDPSQLLYLTSILRKQVDEYFTRAPLKLLIELPAPEQALPTANEFYGMCENFADCVQSGNSRSELIDAFRYIEGSWQTFDRVFRPLKSQKAQVVLNQIEESINGLRDGLYIQKEQFDSSAAVELAAQLANHAEHIDYQANRWLNKKRPEFRAEAQEATQAFIAKSRRFHESLVRGAAVSQLRKDCFDLYEQWRKVYGFISRCDSEERPELGRLASRTTPALVELRTILELY